MTNIFTRLLETKLNITALSEMIGISRSRIYLLANRSEGARANNEDIAKAAQAIYLWERLVRDLKVPAEIASEDLERYRRELGL